MMRGALLFFLTLPLFAADLRPELEVTGRVEEISLAPDGGLWVATAMGNLYRSEDGGRTWAEANVPSRKITAEQFFGDDLDRVTFFDERRGMISGYIGEEQDRVLLTADGGETWTPAQLPVSGFWAYDAQATADGHAWLVGSDGSVLRSDDYGRTWRALTLPFDEEERTSSVHFASPENGVAGTLFSGDIAVTRNGGRTWQRLTAKNTNETRRGCGKDPDKRVARLRIVDGRVISRQCGGVWATTLDAPRVWTRLAAGGKPLVDFDARGSAIVGVNESGALYQLDFQTDPRALGMQLPQLPLSISASGNHIAAIDPTLKVTVFDGEAWFSSRMFGKGVATSWPIRIADRDPNDVLWGISSFFLYRSTDGAKTWERIAELPAAAEHLHIQGDGNVLLADGHGWVGRWETEAGRLAPAPVLNGLDVVGSFRRTDLWLLYGGRQYDTAGRVEVAQTFFSGQFAGSVDYGFVAASADGGRTWSVIDRWQDEGPQAAFLSDANLLTLTSWLGGIRQGTVTTKPPAAAMTTLLSGKQKKAVPYAQRVSLLDLLEYPRGVISGWTHHVGIRTYRTADGGQTWKLTEESPRAAILRLFDGTWLGIARPSALQRWTGKGWEAAGTLPDETRMMRTDSQGSLLVRLEDGTVEVYEPAKGVFHPVTVKAASHARMDHPGRCTGPECTPLPAATSVSQ